MAVFTPDDLPVADLLEYMADGDTAALVQLALGTIQRVTGLESSYLTFIDWTEGTQSIVQSMNMREVDADALELLRLFAHLLGRQATATS